MLMALLLIFLVLMITVLRLNLKKKKKKIAGRIENDGTKNVKAMVTLKNLCNFWRTFEIATK